jgi:hypothetical protein
VARAFRQMKDAGNGLELNLGQKILTYQKYRRCDIQRELGNCFKCWNLYTNFKVA